MQIVVHQDLLSLHLKHDLYRDTLVVATLQCKQLIETDCSATEIYSAVIVT